ncbi:MAG: hypothetical protein DI535_02945 [Citrobacter freundii]|nr:MAG: hypothetical protein DI535_02945 [Citrobacter freundii]
MNKILLIISIILFAFTATSNAQIRKGATLLGGNIGGYSDKQSDPKPDTTVNKQNGISAALLYGKAIRENLVLGVSGYWAKNRMQYQNRDYRFRDNRWGAGIFIRKYKQLGASAFSLFANAALSGDIVRTNYIELTDERKIKGWTASLSAYPGISYAVSKKFQLEAGMNDFLYLGYSVSKERLAAPGSIERKTTDLVFNSSIDNLSNFYFGFRVLLN